MTLHDEVLPGSEALANITYQASSFLYVIDHLLEARAICQRSIDLCEQLYAAGDDHVSLLVSAPLMHCAVSCKVRACFSSGWGCACITLLFLNKLVSPSMTDVGAPILLVILSHYSYLLYEEHGAVVKLALLMLDKICRTCVNAISFVLQRHLRTHRMGTICVADSNFERAELLLVDSEKHFQKHLGPRDPLTGEARLCLAVARIKLLDAGFGLTDPFTKVLAPLKRRDYLTEATAGLAAMQNGYSEGHMLVEKAVQLHKLVADLR